MTARSEQDVGARVRSSLSEPGGEMSGRAVGAVRRARHDRRRVLVPVAAVGVVLVGGAALAAARDDASTAALDAAVAPVLVVPLGRSSMLDLDQVSVTVPGVSGRAPAADVTPTSGAGPPPSYLGGWCGDLVVPGSPPPSQVWAAEWEQQGLAGTTATRGPAGAVREVVLRWPDAASARTWVEAIRTSPTRCLDQRGAPFPVTAAYRPWMGVTTATSATSVAVAPTGPPGLAGSAAVPVWRVRAVHAAGATVVDLTLVVREPGAGDAVRSAAALLEAAAERAAVDQDALA